MKRFLTWLVAAPVAALVIVFAISNRHSVTLVLDPFGGLASGLTFQSPLYLVIFASLLLGVLAGGVAAWLKQGKHRRAAREARAEARKYQEEAQRLRAQLATQPAPLALHDASRRSAA